MNLKLPIEMKVQFTGMTKPYYKKVLEQIQTTWTKVGDTYQKQPSKLQLEQRKIKPHVLDAIKDFCLAKPFNITVPGLKVWLAEEH